MTSSEGVVRFDMDLYLAKPIGWEGQAGAASAQYGGRRLWVLK